MSSLFVTNGWTSFAQDRNILWLWNSIKETDTETPRPTQVKDLRNEKETWKRQEKSLIKGTQPPPVYHPFRLPPPLWSCPKVYKLVASVLSFFFSLNPLRQPDREKKTAFRVSKQPPIHISGKCGTKSESQEGSEKAEFVLFCWSLKANWLASWWRGCIQKDKSCVEVYMTS